MITHAQHFAKVGKANMDALLLMAKSAFDGAEKMAELNLSTSRALLDEGAARARALLDARHADKPIMLDTSLTRPLVDKMAEYARSACAIAAQNQEVVFKAFEAGVTEVSKQLSSTLEGENDASMDVSEAKDVAADGAPAPVTRR